MATVRPQKTWRMNYWGAGPSSSTQSAAEPMFSLLADPAEARMHVGTKSFISVQEDKISISGGFPSVISVQGLSSSMKYAGMIQDLPWPLTMIPSTGASPLPSQIMVPPLLETLPTIIQMATIATSLAGF